MAIYENKYLNLLTIIPENLNNKYSKIYYDLMNKAILRASTKPVLQELLKSENNPNGYCESHHILPQSFNMGGYKDKKNLAFLTAKEHFMAHRLLAKMFKFHSSYQINMLHAVHCLTTRRNFPLIISSRIFEYLRIQISQLFSKAHQGERNPAAILTVKKVQEIRYRYATEPCTRKELTEEYGSGVGDCLSYYTWKHVEDLPLPENYKGKPKYICPRAMRHLTDNQIQEIRFLYKTANTSMVDLGFQFNISKVQAKQIIARKFWNDLQDLPLPENFERPVRKNAIITTYVKEQVCKDFLEIPRPAKVKIARRYGIDPTTVLDILRKSGQCE